MNDANKKKIFCTFWRRKSLFSYLKKSAEKKNRKKINILDTTKNYYPDKGLFMNFLFRHIRSTFSLIFFSVFHWERTHFISDE